MATLDAFALNIRSTFNAIDCRPGNENITNLGFAQDSNEDTAEVQLPPPTTFRRQNKKSGFGQIAGRQDSDYASAGISTSHAPYYKTLVCTDKMPNATEGTRTALNREDWRRVFEQCCK